LTDPPFPFKIDQRRWRRGDTKIVSLSRAIGFDHYSLVLSEKERARCKMSIRRKVNRSIGKRGVWAMGNLKAYGVIRQYWWRGSINSKESLLYTRASRP
jgi:hypothetical protein